MKQSEVIEIFKNTGALMKGHFQLSSGLHSDQYFQCARILENPECSERICQGLAERFRGDSVTVVVGPAMGGVIVAYEVARALNAKAFFAERESSRMCLRRGFALSPQDKVLIAEDVITTGRSVGEVIDIVKESGANLVGVGCIVDRTKEAIDFGVNITSLIKIHIPVFEPQRCPLCKDHQPLIKPGSRK